MVVVSDTSAISNLYQIGLLNVLKELYGELLITPAVQRGLFAIPSQQKVLKENAWIKV